MTTSSGSAADIDLLLSHLNAWRRSEIQAFMRRHSITGLAGSKEELLEAVRRAVVAGTVTTADLVGYLDEIEPGNKQHVILLVSTTAASQKWSTPVAVAAHLAAANRSDVWQANLPLVGDADMKLSAVSMTGSVIDLYAVNRRLHLRRRPDLDDTNAQRAGVPVEERVYEKVYIRAWCRLRWDTASLTATLHISQLPSQQLYSEVRDAFWAHLLPFFPVDAFSPVNLAKAVTQLHALEENGTPEARTQAVSYLSHGNRRAQFSSATGSQGLLHESTAMDSAMQTWRQASTGAGGNFYYLPGSVTGGPNPLTDEVHVHIVVRESRVNFPQPTAPIDLDYVVSRIRALA